jgi:hypothetical protein
VKPKLEVGLACGRNYLSVNGYVVAMEGDLCRDSEIPGTHWNRELLETVVKGERKVRSSADFFRSLPAVDAESEYLAAKRKDREEHDEFVEQDLQVQLREVLKQVPAYSRAEVFEGEVRVYCAGRIPTLNRYCCLPPFHTGPCFSRHGYHHFTPELSA